VGGVPTAMSRRRRVEDAGPKINNFIWKSCAQSAMSFVVVSRRSREAPPTSSSLKDSSSGEKQHKGGGDRLEERNGTRGGKWEEDGSKTPLQPNPSPGSKFSWGSRGQEGLWVGMEREHPPNNRNEENEGEGHVPLLLVPIVHFPTSQAENSPAKKSDKNLIISPIRNVGGGRLGCLSRRPGLKRGHRFLTVRGGEKGIMA